MLDGASCTARELPELAPGLYVEATHDGYSVWVVDEDGDWHEQPNRGVVDADTPRAYYRIGENPTWCNEGGFGAVT